MDIIKRNGTKVPFDKEKIFHAISLANDSVKIKHKLTKTKIREITDGISEAYESGSRAKSVETVQDMVEEALVEAGAYGVAKEYITYRYKSAVARGFGEDFLNEIAKKLKASDVQNQNANIDEHSFGGRVGEATGVMTKKFALDNLISKKSRENHEGNMVYIHDLDAYAVGMHNCLSIPFDKLLAEGFNTRQTDVRPAGSVNTAFQLVAVIFQLQSLQQFGGVSATHLDWTMVPYVRKSFAKHFYNGLKYVERKKNDPTIDSKRSIECVEYKKHKKAYQYALDMTLKEIHQGVEGLFHNLNTLQSRSGN